LKREAVGHTKIKRLCRRLDIPLWQAVGLLELLWHVTAREAPRGDIGKLSNEDIALALDYRGDEDKMVDALVATGWIDNSQEFRLVIHDWHDHADDAVHVRLARARMYFVCARAPRFVRLGGSERAEAAAFYNAQKSNPCAQKSNSCAPPVPVPVPVPEPVPEPAPVPAVRTDRFGEFIAPWPRVSNPDRAARAWISCVETSSDEQAAFAARDRYLASDEVRRGVLMDVANWLMDQKSGRWSGKWPPPIAPNGKPPSTADRALAKMVDRISKGQRPV